MRMNLSRFMALLAGLLLGVSLAATAAEPVAKAQATATAVFAGGCFWCMVHPFDELPGVVSVTSGYTGGQKVNPTYEQVSAGDTGHVEAVQIILRPEADQLRKTAGSLLAQRRSARQGRTILRPRQHLHHPRSSIRTKNRKNSRNSQKRRSRRSSAKRSSPRSARPRRSTRPRTTIRITTRRIRCATNTIATAADAISASRNSGARRRTSD